MGLKFWKRRSKATAANSAPHNDTLTPAEWAALRYLAGAGRRALQSTEAPELGAWWDEQGRGCGLCRKPGESLFEFAGRVCQVTHNVPPGGLKWFRKSLLAEFVEQEQFRPEVFNALPEDKQGFLFFIAAGVPWDDIPAAIETESPSLPVDLVEPGARKRK